MKKKSILLIVLALLLISSISQADRSSKMQVNMNGDNLLVARANITMDGTQIGRDIRSFVHNDRTLVHIRFIEENSNAEVSWEQATRTVALNLNGKKIRLSIDSPIATIDGEKRMLDKGSIPRLAKCGNDKNALTMVPLSFLAEALGYDVGWDFQTRNAYINSEAVEGEVVDNTNKISNIKWETIGGKDAIVVEGTKKANSNIIKMNNPKRIVIDLLDSTLEGLVANSYDYNPGFIKGIRVSQFTPDLNYKAEDKIVRIVLDVKDGVSNPDIDIDSNSSRLILFPEKFSWDMGKVAGNKEDIGANVEEDVGNSNKLEVNRGGEKTLVNSALPEQEEFPVESNSSGISNEKTIVIDPGHGGNAPGAVSPNGVKEKDVVLSISLKTISKLENEGYNVISTRNTDTSISLDQRPSLANKNDADIFVSIHANSVENAPSANGIEILYAPSAAGSTKEEAQQLLAEYILDELIRETGAKNRGKVKRPNLVVLRKSEMPAVLIEVGFLSNSQEEKLITSEDYQDRIAKAIVRGINRYFK